MTDVETETPPSSANKIGDILIALGFVTEADLPKIIEYQEEHNTSFGESAVILGFLKPKELEEALAQQFNYSIIPRPDQRKLSDELCIATSPFSTEAESIRALRSQLMLNCIEKGRRAIAVTSPATDTGCTYTCGNIALALAQLGLKTCLVDGNLRSPRCASLFGLPKNTPGLSSVLLGNREYEECIVRGLFPNFSILCSGPVPPNPLELLAKPELVWTLSHLLNEYDAVIFDTPSMNSCADAKTLAARIGSALLVLRADKTLVKDSRIAVNELQQTGIEIIGTVLNKY